MMKRMNAHMPTSRLGGFSPPSDTSCATRSAPKPHRTCAQPIESLGPSNCTPVTLPRLVRMARVVGEMPSSSLVTKYVEAMRELWTSEDPVYHGEFVEFDDVVFEPKPVQDPLPLWFGGRTRAALRRIARLGDGWISYATPRAQFAELIAYIKEQPEFAARPRPLETWIELFEGKRDPDTHAVIEQAKVVLEPDVVIEQLHAIAAVGATQTSLDDLLGIGKFQNDQPGAPPPVRGISEFLERLQWVAEEILPAAHAIAV